MNKPTNNFNRALRQTLRSGNISPELENIRITRICETATFAGILGLSFPRSLLPQNASLRALQIMQIKYLEGQAVGQPYAPASRLAVAAELAEIGAAGKQGEIHADVRPALEARDAILANRYNLLLRTRQNNLH